MPELPEVETIARQIRAHYLNARIARIEARPARIFQNVTAGEFAQRLQGKTLRAVDRHGKLMVWQVDDLYPVFHLGMSGIFIADRRFSRYPGHIHISFYFEGGRELHYQDTRKFGKVFLYRQKPDFDGLGMDPTKENFTLNKLKELLHLKSVNIKTFLMDQHLIAGIGNIYASEILFEAGISPFRPANRITDAEARNLFRAIRGILTAAIDRFGTTYSAYRTVEGGSGENQNFLKVYHRSGQPCPRCGAPVLKARLNNRSTFYCANCQK